MELKRGTQIIYVPDHANDDVNHPDCEPGFTSVVLQSGQLLRCRYWSKTYPGELRTRSNSELAHERNLVVRDTVPQAQVEAALEKYCG